MEYLLVKYVHILSATIILGTGIGSAFFMFMSHRRKNVANIYFAVRHAVIADWLLTTPAVIIQLLTGLYLVYLGHYPLTESWIEWGLALYFFAGVCWLPLVWMQIRMRDMAKTAVDSGMPLPGRYRAFEHWWNILGSWPFLVVAVIFWLMITKPNI